MRRVLMIIVAFALGSTLVASPAAALEPEVVLEHTIPTQAVIRGPEDYEHRVKRLTVPTEHVGRECSVVAQGLNNHSVHPDTDLVVRSGGSEVVAYDIERAPGAVTVAEGTLVLGPEVVIYIRLGPMEVFSGGLIVTVECTPTLGIGTCDEDVNPHGQTTPPAGSTTMPGPKGGQNEDGFYKIGSDTGEDVYVVDVETGTEFGPYPSGTVVKYTEANGATPSEKTIGSTNGQAGAVLVHITGQGDMGVRTAGGETTVCYVPPLPK